MKLEDVWSDAFCLGFFGSSGGVGAAKERFDERMLGLRISQPDIGWLFDAFNDESRLEVEEWCELIDSICEASDGQVLTNLRHLCVRYILGGPKCDVAASVLGHIFSLDDLEEVFWSERIPTLFSEPAVRLLLDSDENSWMRGVQMLGSLVNASLGLKSSAAPVGRRPMWATFALGSDDPVEGLADLEILEALGIPEEGGRDGLYLMKYHLPDGEFARHPRLVEAVTSLGWYAMFRPSEEGEPHGWTCPEGKHVHLKRPLAVHGAVGADALVAGFRLLDVHYERFLLREWD